MPKYFTRAEAERLLPLVNDLLLKALATKAAFQEAKQSLERTAREIAMRGGMAVQNERMLETRRRRDESLARLEEVLVQIQGHGCLVKDLDRGLLDFPTLFEGREVYLCWLFGEPRIEYWHEVEGGFAGRRPIDDAFLANHGAG